MGDEGRKERSALVEVPADGEDTFIEVAVAELAEQ